MIRLGLPPAKKGSVLDAYCAGHEVARVVVLTPPRFDFPWRHPDPAVPCERVGWEDVIRYKFFYRLLREIDKRTLVVVNEMLRTQDRSCLTYNCVRHYLQQAGHVVVFQRLPLIDIADDFMILLDFDTRSRWRRESFRPELLDGVDVEAKAAAPDLTEVPVETTDAEKDAYYREREKLFAGLGLRDPHTLPRNLHLMSGKAKLRAVASASPSRSYVGRNNRFKLPNLSAYKEDAYPHAPYAAFEFPHNFIDFADFLCLSGQKRVECLVADLKADRWYFDRYTAWAGRVRDATAMLQR